MPKQKCQRTEGEITMIKSLWFHQNHQKLMKSLSTKS